MEPRKEPQARAFHDINLTKTLSHQHDVPMVPHRTNHRKSLTDQNPDLCPTGQVHASRYY
jgi:hypothetical protein